MRQGSASPAKSTPPVRSLDASGLPLEEIANEVEAWLAGGGNKDPRASKVIPAWLDRQGPRDRVEGHLLVWLSEHACRSRRRFRLQVLARCRGQRRHDQSACPGVAQGARDRGERAVRLQVLARCRGRRRHDQSACPGVAQGARDRGERAVRLQVLARGRGSADTIKAHVLAWLKEHETAESAQFVYHSWLDAGGDADTIKEHVLAWLKEHETAENAQFVYHSWLMLEATPIRSKSMSWRGSGA